MKAICYIFLIVCLASFQRAFAQNFNRPVPTDFYRYEFEYTPSSFDGYLFTSAYQQGATTLKNIGILDAEGYLVWYDETPRNQLDFKYLPSRNQFSFVRVNGQGLVDYVHLDSAFQTASVLAVSPPAQGDTHELYTISDGTRMVLTQEDTVMDLSGWNFNGSPGSATTTVRANGIQAFDLNDNLIWHWRSTDHIHPSEFIDGYLFVSTDFDYAHANSIAEDTDGHLLVSFRNLDAVYKINRQSGAVIWRLGGRSSDFVFVNDTIGFSGQHRAHRTVDGTIGMYDNGNRKPSPSYSRAVEYALDTINWTATLVYDYDADSTVYAGTTGSYQHHLNGYRCIGWGRVNQPEPNLTLLDDNDQKLAELHLEDPVTSYRAWTFELPWALPRPSIQCLRLGDSLQLSAPSGYTEFQWSTGQSDSVIMVGDTGTYMLWVNYGEGMIGSFPEFVADISTHCGTVGWPEEAANVPDEVVGWYDLLGRPLREPQPGQLNVVRYRSGRSELTWPNHR